MTRSITQSVDGYHQKKYNHNFMIDAPEFARPAPDHAQA
jgi:hypothetical protein